MKDTPKLPEKYPKQVKEGSKMDYSNLAFPKPIKKAKKSKWGKK
jgi:hypothetical protein